MRGILGGRMAEEGAIAAKKGGIFLKATFFILSILFHRTEIFRVDNFIVESPFPLGRGRISIDRKFSPRIFLKILFVNTH